MGECSGAETVFSLEGEPVCVPTDPDGRWAESQLGFGLPRS